eukprot:TRINITY_DN3445_c0_g1_i1.p1 TRINITY_DN3445_c0_g1~~TRINITY_DN3445_c0_g1_i1.p1  ORF type:complete len:130 (+),score=8.17 TRINITY_DN3445_c0_g1_i1:67-456(+)
MGASSSSSRVTLLPLSTKCSIGVSTTFFVGFSPPLTSLDATHSSAVHSANVRFECCFLFHIPPCLVRWPVRVNARDHSDVDGLLECFLGISFLQGPVLELVARALFISSAPKARHSTVNVRIQSAVKIQ